MTQRTIARYRGRLRGSGADDTTPPATIRTLASEALVLAIEDPLSFPWETIITSLATPVLVDVSDCTDDDRSALVPVLQTLTAADVIVDSTPMALPLDGISASVADTIPPTTVWAQRRAAKASLLAERWIIERLEREYGPTVLIDAASSDDPIATAATQSAKAPTTSAIAVCISAHSLAPLGGTTAAARRLLADCDRDRVAGVWGIRPDPGHPLERAIVVLEGRPV